MQWIRENLFLTCVAGTLVVCLAVCYVIRSGQDTAFTDKDMKPRKTLASRLATLSRGESVNKERMKKAKDRLEEIRRQRDVIVGNVDDWNKRNYPVLKLKVAGGGSDGAYPAFPHDSEIYRKKGLTSKFTNAYRVTLYGALAELDLTSWATSAEIEKLSARINKHIQSRRKVAARNVEHALRRSGRTRTRNESPGGDGSKREEKKPDGVSTEDWNLSRLNDGDVVRQALDNARKELMYKKSNAGMIYVSPETLAMVTDPRLPGGKTGPAELDVIFPNEIWDSKNAPATRLWEAQLNLWVSQDILSSIDTTNRQSLRTTAGVRKPTVQNAAIKALDKISITELYLMERVNRASSSSEAEVKPDLTMRATTKEYEIVEYKISLIMKSSYLPVLIKNLMTRGEHTITNVSIVGFPDDPEEARYFGTDPVAQVEVSGEVLFRGGWTRKIMPTETLKGRLTDADVLSAEDMKRLEQEDK
jgi:hypothetical protein